ANPRIDAVNRAVRFAIHTAGSDNVPDDSEKTALAAAYAAWSNLNFCTFKWTRLPDDTRPIASQTGSDNFNTVYWLETTTVDPHGFDMAGALARTPFRFASTGELIDADISFNGVGFTWSTTLANGTQDVGSVAAHEVGHALGMEHSAHQAATMKPTAPNFDRSAARSLSLDDLMGVQRRYPSSTYATQRGRIAGTIRTSSNINVHAGIVVARRVSDGLVAAAVLSTQGNYSIDGLIPGAYIVQTQALGRSIADEASRFGTFLFNGSTTSIKSIATDDRQANVTAGQTTTVPLVMSDGAIATKIDFIVTRLPGSNSTRANNGPVLLSKGSNGVLVGLIGQGMPTSAGQVAGVDFGTTQITVVSGPHFDSGFSNSVHYFINISPTAVLGPRNIELRLTNGARVICIGGLEIK
ncbi:MAG: matrixin family metalloprotease, partial [Planctomycetota bacterium]